MKKTIRFRLILGSITLFTLAFGINVVLNSSSVDKLCEEAKLAQYRIAGENLLRMLRESPNSEQHNFSGLSVEKILSKATIQLLSIDSAIRDHDEKASSSRDLLTTASILLPDHTIAASTDSTVLDAELESHRREFEMFLKESNGKHSNHYRHNGIYFLNFPIKDRDKKWQASVIVTIPDEKVQIHKNILIRQELILLLTIFFGGFLLLFFICRNIDEAVYTSGHFSKTRLSFMLFVVICSAQIAFSVVTTITFTDQYLRMNKDKARMRVSLIEEQVDLLQIGDESWFGTSKAETILGNILSESPELNDIAIFDHNWHPLYIATNESFLNCQSATTVQVDLIKKTLPDWDPKYNVRVTIYLEDHIQGYISANISKPILYDRLIEIALDSITVLVLSILFLVEMMILIFLVIKDGRKTNDFILNIRNRFKQIVQRKNKILFDHRTKDTKNGQDLSATASQPPNLHYGLMRPAAFLLLFGYDISMSFLPLHTEKLYAPLFGLSKDVIMGLPISVELFFVGICILLSGIWLDKRGWHEPFLAGLSLAGIGTLYSWVAPDVINFIVSRALTGSGYGLALMASQGFVIEYSDARSKAQGLAYLFAGIYAGSLCGSATGAMLADRFGYASVFLAGAVIIFSVIVYSLFFMRAGMRKPSIYLASPVSPATTSTKKLTRFLSNRIVIALVFFSSLPAAVAVVGFLNYFSPIYLNRIGASQSTIGRILMIYGICLIYIGPLISRYVDASNKKRIYIFIGCALGSLAFLTFNVVEGIVAAAVSMLLLGLSSSFVLASQSAYTLRLKVTEDLGAGKSIGIFRSTSRGGQVLGPIVFSWLIISTDIIEGITYFGLAYFVFAIIFLILTVKDKPQMAF